MSYLEQYGDILNIKSPLTHDTRKPEPKEP